MLLAVLHVKLDQGFDWPAWLGAIAALATFGVVGVTAFFAWRSLRDARRTRYGQLVMDVIREWDAQRTVDSARQFRSWGPEGLQELVGALWGPDLEARYDLKTEQGKTDYEKDLADWYDLSIYPNLIDAIGVLASEEALSLEVIDRMWGSNILTAWTRWEQPVKLLRNAEDDQKVWWGFEHIADRLTSYRETEGWSRADRLAYWLLFEPY